MTTTNTEDLRPLYDAACQAKLSSTKGRSFEEWSERVSEDGLSLARQVLSVQLDRERVRLEKEVRDKAKTYIASPSMSSRMDLKEAVEALQEFEGKHSK